MFNMEWMTTCFLNVGSMTLEFDCRPVLPSNNLVVSIVHSDLVNCTIMEIVDVPLIKEGSSACVINVYVHVCITHLELGVKDEIFLSARKK